MRASSDAAGAGVLRLGRCEVDLVRGELRRDGVVVQVRRKVWQLLVLLCSRRGAVVSPVEIARSLWPGTSVSDQGVFTLVGEVREVLGGGSEARRLLATVRGRGYRLVVEDTPGVAAVDSRPAQPLPARHPCFVGRERELRAIDREWERAATGEPRAVFVAGEPGIGKTTLVREAIARHAGEDFRLARGNCIRRDRGVEPHGPVLDAFHAWIRDDERGREAAFRLAPLWAELLLPTHATATGPLAVFSSRPDRMLREATSLLEELSRERLHVLVLEDAHWADPYTLELVHFALRRLPSTRLLVLVTYRAREALQRGVPVERLALDLRDHDRQVELGPLGPGDAAALVRHRAGAELDARSIFESAAGNPLFLEAFADRAAASLEASAGHDDGARTGDGDLPAMFRRVVESQCEPLAAQAREAVVAGAVVGAEFDVATVAAALQRPVAEVEAVLDRPAGRPPFVIPAGTTLSPSGSPTPTYRFRHEAFRRVVRDSLTPARAARLHAAIGKALSAGGGGPSARRAIDAAEHLVLGGLHGLAVEQLEVAATECIAGSAIPEAIVALERALDCIGRLPASRARDRRELRLLVRYGLACGWLRGPADPAMQGSYERGLPLLERVDDPAILGPALRGMWLQCLVHFDYHGMNAIAARMEQLAPERPGALFQRQAACLRGAALCFLGRQVEALACLEPALEVRSRVHGAPDAWGIDLDAELGCYTAWSATLAGRLGLAARALAHARRHATRAAHTGTHLLVLWFECSLAQLTGRRVDLERHVAEFCAIAHREDQEVWDAVAETLRATLELERGNVDSMRLLMETLGGGDGQPTLLIARAYLLGQMAAAVARDGHGSEGLALVDAALRTIERNDGRVSESDFWRIKGEIHEHRGEAGEAEAALRKALAVARDQGAGLFERRAALALARVLVRDGRREEAGELLAPIARRFGAPVTPEQAAALEPLSMPPTPVPGND